MEVVLDDIGADAIKTGMLHDAAVMRTVATVLEARANGRWCSIRDGGGRRAADRTDAIET